MTTLSERLEAALTLFRESEKPEAAATVTGDPVALAVAAAWRRVPSALTDPLFLGVPPLHRHNRWKYVWRFRSVDIPALANEAHRGEEETKNAFEALRNAFLIYPDGTLHVALQKLLPLP